MRDVYVLLSAVDSAMSALTVFDNERADVTARVSFALSSLLARTALETEQCRRELEALEEAEACRPVPEDNSDTFAPQENTELSRLRAKLDALEQLNRQCALSGAAFSAEWQRESRTAEQLSAEAQRRMGFYLRKLNRIALPATPALSPNAKSSASISENIYVCIVDSALYPETAEHIRTAQDVGFPSVLTLDRTGAAERRKASLMPVKASRIWDRDEYPCACFKEGGAGAHVMYVNGADNRGAGSYMGWQMRNLPDGARVRVRVI